MQFKKWFNNKVSLKSNGIKRAFLLYKTPLFFLSFFLLLSPSFLYSSDNDSISTTTPPAAARSISFASTLIYSLLDLDLDSLDEKEKKSINSLKSLDGLVELIEDLYRVSDETDVKQRNLQTLKKAYEAASQISQYKYHVVVKILTEVLAMEISLLNKSFSKTKEKQGEDLKDYSQLKEGNESLNFISEILRSLSELATEKDRKRLSQVEYMLFSSENKNKIPKNFLDKYKKLISKIKENFKTNPPLETLNERMEASLKEVIEIAIKHEVDKLKIEKFEKAFRKGLDFISKNIEGIDSQRDQIFLPALDRNELFRNFLIKIKEINKTENKSETIKYIIEGIEEVLTFSRIITDEVRLETSERYIYGRQEEIKKALNALSRMQGRAPVFIGPPGVGKRSVVYKMAQNIISGVGLDIEMYKKFKKAEILQISVENFNSTGLYFYLKNVADLQNILQKPLIIFIEDIHKLGNVVLTMDGNNDNEKKLDVLKERLNSGPNNIYILGVSNSLDFQAAFRENKEALNLFEQIGVSEFSTEEVFEILKHSWISKIEKEYKVKFSERVFKRIIEMAPQLVASEGRIDAAIKILMDFAISAQVKQEEAQNKNQPNKNQPDKNQPNKNQPDKNQLKIVGNQILQLQEKDFFEFIKETYGYPVNPNDFTALNEYLVDIKTQLKKRVLGQNKVVENIVELWGEVLRSQETNLRVGLFLGSTGVGKTYLANELSKIIFPGREAVFEIDGTMFQKNIASKFSVLLGLPHGHIGKETEAGSGLLLNWLSDPTRGKEGGIIVINEAERASPEFWERFMEFFDTGKIVGNDGKAYVAKNILVILTSNRGDEIIYPKGIENWGEKEIKEHIDRFKTEDIKDVFQSKVSAQDSFSLPDAVLGRIDSFFLFNPITEKLAFQIAMKYTDELIKKYEKDYDLNLKIDKEVIRYIVNHEFKIKQGVRPLKQKLEQYLYKTVHVVLKNWQKSEEKLGQHEKRSQAAEEITLKLEITKDLKYSQIRIEKPNEEKPLFSQLPEEKLKDPFEDKELMNRLLELPKKVSKEIFGQTELVEQIGRTFLAHASRAENTKPLSFFLVGRTGTGKTGIWAPVAKALYGSEKRVTVIPLGGINHEVQFSSIFGSSAGLVGSENIYSFEQGLRNNPNGGIFVFDEASNMGGHDKSLKENLFKKFYDITDGLSWTSIASGKTYDLSKYIFVFTGNDGEKLIQAGGSHDDMRETIWKEMKSREKLTQFLVENGVPEAFLGRITVLSFQKPLNTENIKKVVKKFLDPLVEANKNWVHIKYTDEFLNKFSRAFFTQAQGARSVKDIIENYLSSFLVETRLEVLQHEQKGRKVEFPIHIELLLKDNLPDSTYVEEDFEKRKVELGLEVYLEETQSKEHERVVLFSKQFDLSERVSEVMLPSKREALKTAYHETGHAIVNIPEVTQSKLEYITIIPGDKILGYARYEEIRSENLSRRTLIYHVARLLAGGIAQKIAGFNYDMGMSNDYEKAIKLIDYALKSGGAGEEYWHKVNIHENEKPMDTKYYEKYKKEIINEASDLAKNILKTHWNVVEKITKNLMEKGFILGDEFRDILKKEGVEKIAHDFKYKKGINGVVHKAKEKIKERTAFLVDSLYLMSNNKDSKPVVSSKTQNQNQDKASTCVSVFK